jgi:hypothetical protein
MRPTRTLDDRAWRGYDPRAAVPVVGVAAAVSAALLAGRWYLADLSGLADRGAALAVYALVLAGWSGLVAGVLYRSVTYTYRLTDRALLLDWGPLSPPVPPAWLADVTAVVSGATWLGRQLGVGWVRVSSAGGRTVRLTGVRDPGGFALAIRAAAEQARAAKPGRPA